MCVNNALMRDLKY